MGFYDILEGLQACAALRFFTTRAGGVNRRNLTAATIIQVFAHFLVAERVAKANHHGENGPSGNDLKYY